MTDYQQGKIYAIRSSSTDKYYIGSTATTLCKRFYKHKTDKNTSATEIIDLGDAYIELIELFPCGSKIELNKREGEIQREMKASIVNKMYAHRTPEQKKEQQAEYYAEHVEELKESNAAYYAEHVEQIKEYRAEYYAENQEEILLQKKEYYQKNKAEIDKIRQTKHDCECGGKYTTGNKSKHIKTKLHQTYLAQ
jgi:hypothetical protein